MRFFSLMTIAALFAGSAVAAEAPKGQERYFPMAVWYGGGKARAPMLEPNPEAKKEVWRKDLQQIKKLGFNTVRTWVDWATAEPKEGEFDFRNLETLADLAAEEGLRLLVQVYVDSAPDWVGEKYPDSHFISISGDVMPSHAAPGYCFDHPGVRDAILGFYEQIAKRMSAKPAFLGWDLWSEPHIINWAYAPWLTSAEYCFCPYTKARFRSWLQDKYGTLEALNEAWYRRFDDWDDVGPNRLGTILSYTDFIDWRMFIRTKLAEDLEARYDTVKSVLPNKVATSHAASPNLFTSPLAGDGSPDDLKMAGVVDYFGTSFYPKHSAPVGRDVAWRGAILDFAKSMGYARSNGFYVGELQAGFGTIALRISDTVTPQDESIWIWTALSRGAKAVNVYAYYPMSSGYESGGFGLINLDGTITPRARAAGAVAAAVDRNQELFLDSRPAEAEVAIVFNPLSYMVGGRRPQYASVGQGELMSIERNAMLGPYRALYSTNVPVDYIHVDQIANGEVSKYKLIYFPYPLMISTPVAEGLARWVRNGGSLVTEARAAWNDERGYASEVIPGQGLAEVCACREDAIQTSPTQKTHMTLATDFLGIEEGEVLPGAVYEEVLLPTSDRGKVVATWADGSPAMVESRFGEGRMLTIGTFFGSAYENEPTPLLDRFFEGLLDWADVSRPVSATEDVEVRLLESEGDLIAIVFNHEKREVAPEVRIAGVGKATARDLMTGEAVELERDADGVVIRPRMAPESVLAIHLIR
ncbi:MAG: beta-galactosidase [Thermoanaerobaculia bacterium]